jgi:hypothetical protein
MVLCGVRPVLPNFALRENYLSYFGSSVGRVLVVLQYAILYCKGLSLGPVALVGGPVVAVSVHPVSLLRAVHPTHHGHLEGVPHLVCFCDWQSLAIITGLPAFLPYIFQLGGWPWNPVSAFSACYLF